MDCKNNLITAVNHILKKYHMLEGTSRVVLGLSGGADSCALLYALHELDVDIFAVHVNHNLRGEEALSDQQFCQRLCEELNIPLEVINIDVKHECNRGEGLEEAGRRLRYQAFDRICHETGAEKIAVAHNKNDNAETILMNLLRGTGLRGLTGIPAVRGRIIRPLIETERCEIEAYCHEHNIDFRSDSSNAENEFTRNKIRNLLLPKLAQEFNPNIIETLCRMGNLLAEDERSLDSTAQTMLGRLERNGGLNAAELAELDTAISGRVLRKYIERECGGIKDISAVHIAAVLKICRAESGSGIDLPNDVRMVNEYGVLRIIKKRQHKDGYCYRLIPDKPLYVPESNLWVCMSRDKNNFVEFYSECSVNVCTKVFDCDKIKSDCFIRTRRAGDRIYFSGVGTKKLKDFFINKKIPRDQRDRVPLLACGDEILSIVGYGDNSRYTPSEGASNIIYIKIWRATNEGICNSIGIGGGD